MKRLTFTVPMWTAARAGDKTVTRRVTARPPKVGERLVCVTAFSHSGPPGESPKQAHAAGRTFWMPHGPWVIPRWSGRYLPRERESLGFIVEIVSVTPSTPNPSAVDDAEAAREGFASAAAFRDTWREIHGCYKPDAPCWRVEFRRVS